MPNDEIKIPLDVFPQQVQSAMLEIALDTGLSAKQKQEKLDSITFKAMEDPTVREEVRENLISKYPELRRQLRPDTNLESQESYSLGGGPWGLILILLMLLRYPLTWLILGIALLVYLASHAHC